MPSGGESVSRSAATPEDLARAAFNGGVRSVERGDELSADAARQTDERKRTKARAKAEQAYQAAMKKFTRATELMPAAHEAWNYLGYSNRKLGNHDSALAAYDRALSLKPGYPEAIEYRGHAYLGLNRIDDAKQAYLNLFASNRQLAAKLLAAMQEWVGEHRAAAGGDGATVDAFASWISERSSIAGQTAGLTREGAAASWR